MSYRAPLGQVPPALACPPGQYLAPDLTIGGVQPRRCVPIPTCPAGQLFYSAGGNWPGGCAPPCPQEAARLPDPPCPAGSARVPVGYCGHMSECRPSPVRPSPVRPWLVQTAPTITSYAPNWPGLRVLGVLTLVPAGVAGIWTGSPKKAALAGGGVLALAVLGTWAAGGSNWLVRPVYAPTSASR